MNNNEAPTSNTAPADLSGIADAQLVARCQSGDTTAFDELITRHRQHAFSMIYHIVRNQEDAWDLAQDGFLRAWKNIGNFRGQSSFFTWLYRIMTNVSLDWLRRKHIRSDTELDDTIRLPQIETSAPTAPKATPAPSDQITSAEIHARIHAAIEKLSPDHRAVILLREIDGLEYHEIADAIGCSIGTVMSRLFYARKKLQTQLHDIYEQL